MLFKYKGYDKDKNLVQNTIEAASSREAIQELEREGVFIILSLKPAKDFAMFKKYLGKLPLNFLKSSENNPKSRDTKKTLVNIKTFFQTAIEKMPLLKSAGRTIKIQSKESEIVQLLKKIDDSLKESGPSPKIDIFVQPAKETWKAEEHAYEKPEFRKKERVKKPERQINWAEFKRHPQEIRKVRVPFKDIVYFTRQLSVLLSSGVSLPTSLLTLAEHTNNSKMKRIIKEVNQEVQEGNSLSYAMSRFPNQFNNLYVSLISVGEASGTLAVCLNDLASFLELQNKLRKKVRGAMIYPGIIMTVVLILLILGSKFFIPMFKELFMDINLELPWLTRTVFWLADYVQYVALGMLVLGLLFVLLSKRLGLVYAVIKQALDRVSLKLPIVKKFALTYSMFYFTNPLALMQKNGIRLIDSLKMVYNVVPNQVIRNEIEDAASLLLEGVNISEALSEQPHFDSVLCSMIKTGEDSGRIDQVLAHLADYYSEQLKADSEMIIQAVQPMMILMVAAIVIPVLFAIFIPLLDLTSGQFLEGGF